MPYDFHWQDEEHTIIRFDIQGEVTWPLWDAAVDQVIDELAKTSKRVDLIFNDSVGMPEGNALPHLKMSTARLVLHDNMGLVITVSSRRVSAFTQMMLGIVSRIYGVDMSHSGGFVETMDNALALVAQDRMKRSAAA